MERKQNEDNPLPNSSIFKKILPTWELAKQDLLDSHSVSLTNWNERCHPNTLSTHTKPSIVHNNKVHPSTNISLPHHSNQSIQSSKQTLVIPLPQHLNMTPEVSYRTTYPCFTPNDSQFQNQESQSGDKNSREVRNETQKRYRERQRQKETTILASVQMLRERRMGYELNRDMMKEMLHKIHTTNSQRRVMIVQEYHKLFENGYGLTASIREKQEEFIYTRIHWKCRIQDELNSGPRDLLKKWKYLSQVLSHFSISINQTNVYGNMDIIVARGQVNFEVTRKSIEMYFPHILQENSVVKQLEGHLMELKILIHYYFDDYQIVSIQIEHNGTIELWKIFEDLLTVKKILSTPEMEKKVKKTQTG